MTLKSEISCTNYDEKRKTNKQKKIKKKGKERDFKAQPNFGYYIISIINKI
jgi:hypothetical protein